MPEVSMVEQLEQQKTQAKEQIARRDACLRLAKNPDFKMVIMDGFCLHDAAAYVQASQDPSLAPDARADALNMAQASGHLKRYLSVLGLIGDMAERNTEDLEDAINEARAEAQSV